MRFVRRRFIATAAVCAAVFGGALAAGVPASAAAGGRAVTPGERFTAHAGGETLTDDSTGTQLDCDAADAAGSVLDTAGNVSIDTASWTGCAGPLSLDFAITATGLPWRLNVIGESGSVVTGTVTGVMAHMAGPGCTADVGGPGGTSGTVDVSFDTSTDELRVLGTGDLHAYNVGAGCLGLLNTGDAISYTADYLVTFIA